jgi:hypothetical protein
MPYPLPQQPAPDRDPSPHGQALRGSALPIAPADPSGICHAATFFERIARVVSDLAAWFSPCPHGGPTTAVGNPVGVQARALPPTAPLRFQAIDLEILHCAGKNSTVTVWYLSLAPFARFLGESAAPGVADRAAIGPYHGRDARASVTTPADSSLTAGV